MAKRRDYCEKIRIQSWCLLQVPAGRLWLWLSEWSGANQDEIKALCNTQRYVVFNIEVIY